MGGAGLIAIRRRIKSVTNTRKITKAMGLVATAKLRKAREKLNVNQKYYSQFGDVVEDIFKNLDERSIYINGNGSKKKLYIVFTSDMGLCGGFNINVVNETLEVIRRDNGESLIMVVGQKGKNYFNRLKFETAAEYVEVPDLPGIKEAVEISRHAISLYKNSEIGEIYAVFTRFITAVKQQVEVQKLLPIELEDRISNNDFVLFEPELSEFIEETVNLYLNEQMLYCLLNSKSSENSSRMNAMDGATKNANDLIEKLNLTYNRVRQSAITQEISEIVGGAEAQR